MRKSAGAAALVIAPLAAVSLAPQAKSQTIFNVPEASETLSGNGTNTSFFSGSGTSFAQSYLDTGVRFGRSVHFTTSGGGISGGLLTIGLAGLGSISPTMAANQSIDYTYDFNIAVDPGLTVNWVQLRANFADGEFIDVGPRDFLTLYSGTTGHLTGSGTFLTSLDANDYYTFDLRINVTSSEDALNLFLTMSSESQGVTLNATAAAVPEPSAYVLVFGFGALGFVMLRRSRRCAA